MKTTLFPGIAVCLGALSLIAQAPPRTPIFVTPDQLNIAALLPNPPATGSAALKADLAELHRIQETRTPAQIAHAKADEAEESMFAFKDVVGPRFTREALPKTALLSDHVHSDEGVIVNPAKTFFHRPRPYNFDSTIKPVCKVSANMADYSYPGGHATTGYLEALTLMMLLPEKRDAILARADDYAHSRAVCGVHYPADLVVSKYTAYAMMGIMVNNPRFRQELEAARSELRAVLGI